MSQNRVTITLFSGSLLFGALLSVGCNRTPDEHPGHIEPVEGVEHVPPPAEEPDGLYRCIVSELVCEEYDDSAFADSCTDFGGEWAPGPCSEVLGTNTGICTLEFKRIHYGGDRIAAEVRERCESQDGEFAYPGE